MIMRMRYMLHMVCETNLLWSYGRPQEADFGHGRHGLVLVWWLSAISLVLSTVWCHILVRVLSNLFVSRNGKKTSSCTLHNVSMVLDMCKKCFSKLQTIILIPTHGLQKKTDRKFRWEVTRKWCAKFENAPWYQTDGSIKDENCPYVPALQSWFLLMW